VYWEIVCRTVSQPSLPTTSTVELTHPKPSSRIGVASYKRYRNATSIFPLQRPLSALTRLPYLDGYGQQDVYLPVPIALPRCHRASHLTPSVVYVPLLARIKSWAECYPSVHTSSPHWRAPSQGNSQASAYCGQIRYENSSARHKLTSLHGNESLYHDHLINFGSLRTDPLPNTASGPPYTSPATRSFISPASLVPNYENIKSPGYPAKLKLLVSLLQLSTSAHSLSNPPTKHVY
jgi:hypothetical protein